MKKPIKILIVEDELIVSRDISRALTKLGHQVVATTASGEEALKIASESSVELVLLDINIEGKRNGIEIAKVIKREYAIPVIFLTALSDEATLEKAKVAEPYGYIVKPFEDEDLKAALEMAYYKFTKDQETIAQHNKVAEAVTHLSEALITINENYTIEFISPAAELLTGKTLIKKDGEVHISKVIEFYTLKKEKLSYTYFFNQSSEIKSEKIICYFPYQQHEQTLFAKTHIIEKHTSITGWALLLAMQEPLSHSLEQTPLFSSKDLPTTHMSCIFAKKGKRYVRVSFEDILWVEAMDNFVIIHTIKEEFVLYITLRDLESKLPANDFIKIHRSYIIRLDKVSYLEEDYVKINEKMLPVSRTFKKIFKERSLFI